MKEKIEEIYTEKGKELTDCIQEWINENISLNSNIEIGGSYAGVI